MPRNEYVAIPESAVWYAKSFKNETNLVENNLYQKMAA
jgi:hypothetical protein